MKSSNHTIPTELHDSLKQFILDSIRMSQVYMVFYTPVANSNLKLLTLVVAKDTDGDTLAGLYSQIKVLDALTRHDTLISVNYHTVAPHHSQLHFSFLQLHLQPCFIVYADQPKRWNSLFQNFYSNDKQKASVLFANHIKAVEHRVKEAVIMLVEPLVKQQLYQAAHAALLESFSYYIDVLKNVLLPKSVHQDFNEQEFLRFIELYYPELSKNLKRIAKIKTVSFNDQSQYLIGHSHESLIEKITKRVVELQTGCFKRLKRFYIKRLESQIPDTVRDESVLLKQLVSFLTNCYKIDAVYLLSKNRPIKPDSDNTYKFNLLLIAPALRIQQHDVLAHKVSHYFKGRVEVFCVIHTLEWLQNNGNRFQLFFKEFIIPQNLRYLRNNLTINDNVLESNSMVHVKQLQKHYWNERLLYITPWFIAFQQENLVYRSGHILLLKSMFQHLVLGLLYQKVQYVPAMYSCKYLMQLLEAFLPEVYNVCVQTDDVQQILDLLNTSMSFFPRPVGELPVHDQLVFTKALCLCEKLYNQAQCE
ncbi:MAG: hypothetical protein RSE19_07845 [Myroides sp.]